jgi:translation initiation factor IF-2
LSIRIYALAKQLKLDSKSMADICKQAGVTGKGSALASLNDEEVDKIKAFMSGGKGGKSAARAAGPSIASVIAKGAAPTEADSIRREDYVAPGGTVSGRVPVLKGRPEKASPKKPAAEDQAAEEEVEEENEKEKKGKTSPAIKLAPMPTAKQPRAPKVKEPAAQKPDIKLPPDAIRGSKLGAKPLAEELDKHVKKRKTAAAKKAAPKPAKAPEPFPAGPPSTDRARGRRGGRRTAADGTAVTLGGREQRQLRRRKTTARRSETEGGRKTVRRPMRRIRRTGADTAAPRKSNVVVELPCTVRTFSEAVSVSAAQVLGKLLGMGADMTINISAQIDPEMAELLAVELGVEVDFRRHVDLEHRLLPRVEQEDEDPEMLKPRPPVITFLGHVDHGKTSLLDRIIGIDVVSGEKGGITQHIRAYRIEKNGRAIAFVDTPGHEAFTEMRARGANVTDIAVLVVAADDGVMPQTEEAISHARAAEVPIVVALNKIDLPGVSPQRALEQLAAVELLASEWGGDTEVIKTSATTGEGMDELLETLLTVAELHEYKANPDRAAVGTCLEAELHEGRGVVCKLLVERGTLRVGDVVVCGSTYGRVKAMYDTLNPRKRHKEAGPSTPVNVTGMNEPPGAGDRFHVVPEIAQARQIAQHRAVQAREISLGGAREHVTLENLFERLEHEDEVQTLNIILRADVRGSIEAIRNELGKLKHPEVRIKILQATVGGVTEADVHLADASDAVIIGFSVVPDEAARSLAEKRGVQIRRYDVIYEVSEDVRAALEGMLKPERRDKELGRALVQRTFQISRVGTIAGCRVLAGNIMRDAKVRVIRDSRVIGTYPLDSLKREKNDAREVREGMECGIKLKGFNDLKEGDVLEAYMIEEVARTF